MIEIKKDELRFDETVLKYATDEEMKKLRDKSKAICRRIQKGGADNEWKIKIIVENAECIIKKCANMLIDFAKEMFCE